MFIHNMRKIIYKIIHLYEFLFYKIFYRLHMKVLEFYNYDHFCTIFNAKELKEDILTKEQKLEIDNFYKKNYGKKIPYIWHNLFTKYSGKFDVKYIPVDIFFKIIYAFNVNGNFELLQDKNFLYKIANSAGVKTPKRHFYSVNNILFDSVDNIISEEEFYKQIANIGEVFIKPTQINNTGYAKDCKFINVVNGIDTYSRENIKDIIAKRYNKDFIVQEKIICHKSVSNIYSQSCNTFGLVTLMIDNKVKVLSSMLKVGMSGNKIDFAGFNQKGLVVEIKEDGTLSDTAFYLYERKKCFSHPDTDVIFKDYKINLFPKILEAATKIQISIPWMPFCSMDFIINEQGEVVLLELETPACVLNQIIYGKNLFGEDTEKILSLAKTH